MGTDSLGYVHGNTYSLHIEDMTIERADGSGGRCPYGSLEAFLRNWDTVDVERFTV
jgi:hypothetical protein